MQKHLIAAVSSLLLAGTVGNSSAWAKWGCYAKSSTGSGSWGISLSAEDQQAAREIALKICRQAGDRCNIVECRDDIDTNEQAEKAWPAPNAPTVHCGGPGEKKCL